MKRREFVAVSSGATFAAGMSSPALGGTMASTEGASWVGCIQALHESDAGFSAQPLDFSEMTREQKVRESGGLETARPGLTWELTNAAKFPAADFEWVARGACARLLCLPGDAQRMTVDVLFEPFHANTFRVCDYEAQRIASNRPPIRQQIPVDGALGLNFRVQLTDAAGETKTYPVHFSANGSYGAPQLSVGLFAAAFSESGIREVERLVGDRNFRASREPVILIELGYGAESPTPALV